ncbi:MAG TPA: hypothetical protein VHY32_04550 [Caulobacteraceae bacterium]|nr:hypothetical protein [Caulobacteraceae bacterium]
MSRHLAPVHGPIIFVLCGLALVFLMGYRIIRASHQDTPPRLAAEAERVANAADQAVDKAVDKAKGRTPSCVIASLDPAI